MLLEEGFPKEAEGSKPLRARPELTQQQRGSCLPTAQLLPLPTTASNPNPVGGLRGQLQKCASCPHPLPGLRSHPTCQSGHMAAPPPEEPGRAAASQHTQGSHMLARPPGMQARVLPWHGAHSRAQPGQCTAWQMAAGWGPGGERERLLVPEVRVGVEAWAGGGKEAWRAGKRCCNG